MKMNFLIATMSLVTSFPEFAQAELTAGRVTDYYTMVNTQMIRRHCRTEGNQIVNGQLYGSDCKPIKKYCAYGMGNHNNCIRPCLDGAGNYKRGSIVKIKPRLCKWGPNKGKWITRVKIVDSGGAVNGSHVDVFQGLCRKTSGGVCREFASDTMVAQYGGQGFTQMANLEPRQWNMSLPDQSGAAR